MPNSQRKNSKEIEKFDHSWRSKIFKFVLDAIRVFGRNKTRTYLLPDEFIENLDFFEHIKFLEKIKTDYPGVAVEDGIGKKTKKREISVKGKSDVDVYNAYNKCQKAASTLARESVLLKEPEMWDILADGPDGENTGYLVKLLESKGIQAKVKPDGSAKSDKVFITAMSDVELKRAKNALLESLIVERVTIPRSGVDITAESTDFRNFKEKAEKNKILRVRLNEVGQRSNVVKIVKFVGKEADVLDAKTSFNTFYESKKKKERKYDVPLCWEAQPQEAEVRLINLQQSSSEFKEVLEHWNKNGGRQLNVQKIERIQNPALYEAYKLKKKSMPPDTKEMKLFHGTNVRNIPAINCNNFDRSFFGKNASRYGNGVYFARDAWYSAKFCTPSNHVLKMYVVRVLVGEYALGKEGMKAPPSRNDFNNPGKLFDSLVDDMTCPRIFVIFNDHQCYPEYLITFD